MTFWLQIYVFYYQLAGLPGVARDGERRNRIEMLCIV